MNKSGAKIYVEFLTTRSFFKTVLPLMRKLEGRRSLYIYDVSPMAHLLAVLVGRLKGFSVEKLDFQMTDCVDDNGMCVVMNVRYKALAYLRSQITREETFREVLEDDDGGARLRTYLAKSPILHFSLFGYSKHSELWHALVLIGVTQWHENKTGSGQSVYLCMYDRPFWGILERYAGDGGVILQSLGLFHKKESGFEKAWTFVRKLNLRLILSLLRYPGRILNNKRPTGGPSKKDLTQARVATEYFGRFNLDHPERISDLFFLNDEGIAGSDVCLIFNNMKDPVDESKWKKMSARGITSVARTVQASLIDEERVPVFRHNSEVKNSSDPKNVCETQKKEYEKVRDYWRRFFIEHNIRLFTSWYKYDADHMALADALRDVGGISSIYQRSFETNPSPYFTIGSDIIFGFSSQGYDIHVNSGSDFKYYVTVGYLGDDRFEHLHALSGGIRKQLEKRGAKHIVAYFDENSISDGRWFRGNTELQENYGFWINKIFEDRDLGVIFKPKIPGSLFERLGPVGGQLRAALKTGRCYLFNEGVIHSTVPPAAAALAADISVQDCSWGGTAAIESALAGCRTLFLNLGGCSVNSLNALGSNIVFDDHVTLWKACQAHWGSPNKDPLLGNWDSVIEMFDPFRDGLAMKRMSMYLKGLLEGLRRGGSPDDVMAEAVGKYVARWGKDKVMVKMPSFSHSQENLQKIETGVL